MVILSSSLVISMDLLEFVTVLLYDYEMLYCVLAFTFLMCFWELNI